MAIKLIDNLANSHLELKLRPPEQVMRLERMGAAFPTRISFLRSLLRRMHRESWEFDCPVFDLDMHGYGVAVYSVHCPHRAYSLVAIANALEDDQRTDRVIAEAWDASFVLFDGIPSKQDLDRIALCAPMQEAARFEDSELILSRANRSLRLFDYVSESLAAGVQPEIDQIKDVGYLMRTTAVYGNGKFGIGDRETISDRPELSGPFQAEMLTVYLIRWFTFDQVEHVARSRAPDRAVPLRRELKRFLGIGNATGLGMAPFLVTHPELVHRWVSARETALARVRQVAYATPESIDRFKVLLTRCAQHLSEWWVEDKVQQVNILENRAGIAKVKDWTLSLDSPLPGLYPWDSLYLKSEEGLPIETQEILVSILIELYPNLVDELEAELSIKGRVSLNARQGLKELTSIIEINFGWALEIDFELPENQQYFWYVSANKLEPRYGDRYLDVGSEHEIPLGIGREIKALYECLVTSTEVNSLAEFLLSYPEHRYAVRRAQLSNQYGYGEIRDNLIGENCIPLHLLRYKLAFFGAAKFDPKSTLWTRITLFQGAPLPDELDNSEIDYWGFATVPHHD